MRFRTFFIVLLFILLGLLLWSAGLYTDYLWFNHLNYASVFFTVFLSEWAVRLAACLVFFLFLFINLLFMRGVLLNVPNLELRERIIGTALGRMLTPRKITLFFLVSSLAVSFLLSSYTGGLWLEVQQFFRGARFGITDPVFNLDASFYIFRLPFWRLLYTYLQTMVILTILVAGFIYFLTDPPVQVGRKVIFFPSRGQGHLSLLLTFAFLLKAWDYRLKMFELLLSPRGATFGPGYTDLNANLPALWILFFLTLGICVVLIYNIYRRQPRLIFLSVAILIGASLVVGSIYPSLVQQFRVEPNEFAYERPFLEHNINYTLKAYGLDDVRIENYPAREELEWEDLEKGADTLQNVRLWDYRPLLDTYKQLQGIRPYYDFASVDTDRYFLDGEYRQVMLSVREMDQTQLAEQARTWVNTRLQYTHGYGLTMSPVALVSSQGLPKFTIGDIPPVVEGGVELTRPEIYYGELSSNYVIVNSNTREFDYPMGDTNVYTRYEGTGGIPLSNLGRKLLYALKFSDYRILISSEITDGSRIMHNRPVRERASRIAPFLAYDADPYPVIAGGGIYWILDAYTTTNNFPYSEPFGGINYMRNSVKVVVDAYNGTVDYYIVDPSDPLIATYAKIFPALFKSLEEMPEEIKAHLRYPETLLSLQAQVFATYHMTDPVVFYNREDLWQIPNEKYRGTVQPVEPYYTILELPGEEDPEFVLILPFTPTTRDNMIAWMAGRSDGDNYGELVVYLFPKDRVVFGPMQIETRIDQNTLISQQLALWDQRGSRVVRGNLLVLPVSDSILYVEPVFLEAEQSQLPELARVIVGFGEQVVMEPTLEEALAVIFGAHDPVGPEEPGELPGPEGIDGEEPEETAGPETMLPPDIPGLARRAQQLFQKAQESLREGDWSGYGSSLQELEIVLDELAELSAANANITE
ncbi:MAG: UPF0182 family protein [Dethiobacteria bacterium]|jgi:uncharacterized membrane protein (UPF0182 family)